MAHLLLTNAAAVVINNTLSPPSKIFLASNFIPSPRSISSHNRRDVLVGGVFGVVSSMIIDSGNVADAAARRPPPPSPKEKNDPNVSGVLAKVIASKKRKEAMKQSIAQLRDKGKPIINN